MPERNAVRPVTLDPAVSPIPLSRPPVDDELKRAVLAAIDSRQYILGPECRQLEAELAHSTDVKHAVLTSSATAALWLTLRALGVKKGDEILVPSHTAFPTVEAICLAEATPVFVDADEFFTVDAADARAKVTPRTVGIVPRTGADKCASRSSGPRRPSSACSCNSTMPAPSMRPTTSASNPSRARFDSTGWGDDASSTIVPPVTGSAVDSETSCCCKPEICVVSESTSVRDCGSSSITATSLKSPMSGTRTSTEPVEVGWAFGAGRLAGAGAGAAAELGFSRSTLDAERSTPQECSCRLVIISTGPRNKCFSVYVWPRADLPVGRSSHCRASIS